MEETEGLRTASDSYPPIARAAVADPKILNEVINKLWKPFDPERTKPFQIHPEAFRFEPQGARLIVAVAPNPKFLGLIEVPDKDMLDINSLGIVMAVGPEVGSGAPHPGAMLLREPGCILYKQVFIKKYVGAPLRFDVTHQGEYHDSIYLFSERDIVCVDFPENRPDYEIDDPHGINLLGQQLK